VSGDVRPHPLRVVAWSIAMIFVALVVAWAMYQARGVLLLVYTSALLATGFGPIVRAIERQHVVPIGRRLPRWLAILVVYLAIVGTVVAVGFAVVPPMIEQARDLATGAPAMIDSGQQYLIDKGLLDHKITLQEAMRRAPDNVAGVGGDAMTTVAGAVAGVAGGIFGILTILILTFYMLVESDDIVGAFIRLFPRERRPRVAIVARDISAKVSAWLGGQLVLAAVIGVSATIGLWLLGVPFFFVLGLLAAFGELIPMVGPLLSAIPAVGVALTVSPAKALAVAIFFLVQQQVENHVLVPKIMSRQVGVSAVTVIVALLVGGSLLGIAGALLAVPTAAALQVVFDELTGDEQDT
jgi:predicted PurR-regulated permease PerM